MKILNLNIITMNHRKLYITKFNVVLLYWLVQSPENNPA